MKNKKNRFWRFLYKSHRYIGLASAIVLIMLAITGIALNHTVELELDSRMVHSPALLDWYGINAPEKINSFATTHHWLSQINQQLYFDNTLILNNKNILLGAVETDQFIVAAFNNTLVLLSLEGQLIEQNAYKDIQRIGLDKQQAIIIQANNTLSSSNDGLLSWQPQDKSEIIWSNQSHLPKSLAQSIQNHFRSNVLPMERLLLDLHSGRIFGSLGVFIVDLSGIFLILLALSGTAIWLKHKLRSLLHKYR